MVQSHQTLFVQYELISYGGVHSNSSFAEFSHEQYALQPYPTVTTHLSSSYNALWIQELQPAQTKNDPFRRWKRS